MRSCISATNLFGSVMIIVHERIEIAFDQVGQARREHCGRDPHGRGIPVRGGRPQQALSRPIVERLGKMYR
jgi:hypothetical protein